MTEPLGTVRMPGGKPVLEFERYLAHPPHKVWKAITEPDELAHWFPATVETELAVGARIRFRFEDGPDPSTELTEGEIVELDEPRVFAFRWADSVLRFELVPDGDGCVLRFSHTLSGRPTTGDRPSVVRQAPGWHACLAALTARLDGTRPQPFGPDSFLTLAERYADEFGLTDGEVDDTDDGFLLRFQRDLIPPPATVWATLAEGDEPVAGAAVPARFTHGYLEADAVTAVEPGRVVEYPWRHDGKPAGRVRFELRDQQPLGTRLVVTQTVPASLADVRATALAAWQTHLELFFAALFGDVRCPWPAERTEALRRKYAAALVTGRAR